MNGFQAEQIFFFVILLIAPIIGSILISLLNLIIERDIPPFLPQINSQSFGQAIVAIVALLLISQTINPTILLIGVAVLVFLFFTLLLQALIEKRQLKTTQDHVIEVLDDALKQNLRNGISSSEIRDLAASLIDVDFFPESLPNQLSSYPRKKRREKFLGMVSKCLQNDDHLTINEDDLLVPPEKRRGLNIAYIVVTGMSLFLYIVSIILTAFG
jgi:hypothetical protein